MVKKKTLKAAFLDRDGIINQDLSYVYEIEKFKFVFGIFELLKFLNKKNYLIFIITNQSGIARGIYTINQYKKLTEYYLGIFNDKGIKISEVLYCPHHPEFSQPPFNNCSCRKPNPGLFMQIKKKYEIDMENSLSIGDSIRDMEAAYLSGINKRYLISTKKNNSKFVTSRFKSLKDFNKYFFNAIWIKKSHEENFDQ